MTKEKAKPNGLPLDLDLSDEDVYEAMKSLTSYIDITIGDFKEIYRLAYRRAADRIARSVKAGQIMSTPVVWVSRQASLKEVAEKMAAHGISGLPVLEEDGRIAGVISEKDFLTLMKGRGVKKFMAVIADCLENRACRLEPVLDHQAEDIMSAPAVNVREDTPLADIADLMTVRNINRVPVVDADGRLAGIVSRNDIIHFSFLRKTC
ncbi:MAG: CBS domain-containing protein [Thermodesulfobacteriota bacterium]